MTKQVTSPVDVSAFTTDAKFRTWGSTCSTAMQACRLVKTADTGQINWVTVAKPGSANTQAGYEIYRFDDTLQGTAPIYIRVGYGTAGNVSVPAVWLTLGTGTNGAGVITGPQTSAVQGYTTSSSSTNSAMVARFTHTTDGYAFLCFGDQTNPGSANSPGTFVIERTRDADGGANADGAAFTVSRPSGAGTTVTHSVRFDTGGVFSRSPVTQPYMVASIATGSVIPVSKSYNFVGKLYPSMGVLTHIAADISAYSTFSATPFGASARTYLSLGVISQGWNSQPSTGTTWVASVIWED